MPGPDIRVLVGNAGDATPNGASAKLIRNNLQTAFKARPANLTVQVSSASLQRLKKTIEALTFNVNVMPIGATGAKGVSAGVVPTEGNQAEAAKIKASVEERVRLRREEVAQQKLSGQQEALNAKEAMNANAVRSKSTLQLAQFNSYLKTINPKAITEFGAEIQNIRTLLHTGMPDSLKNASSAINAFKARVKECGYEGGNAFTYIQAKVKTFLTYFVSSRLTMWFVSGFRQMVTNVKDLNSALTDLRIVMGSSEASAKALLNTYGQMAQDLGATTKDVANAAVEWQRQGYGLEDTNTLITDSTILSKVGFMDSTEAATALTAAIKGYQLEVGDAIGVVDKFTAVDMKAATSAGDLATALSKTAANAKLAGLDLNDVIGQLAVVNEVMQESPESTGTFYNTMLSRMGMIKAGNLKDPETDEDLSDVESTLRGLGIQLRTSNSEFRNFGEVLDEVGGKWDNFSSVQQRAIATAFAGTRQQTRFLSLMSNWDKAAKYAETAANSAGTATEKFAIYQESLEAKQQSAAAAFEMFSQKLISSGLVAGIYDFGAGLFNLGAKIPSVVISIAELTTGVIALSAAYNMASSAGFIAHLTKLPRDLG